MIQMSVRARRRRERPCLLQRHHVFLVIKGSEVLTTAFHLPLRLPQSKR